MRAPTLAYGDESLKVPAPFDEAQVLDAPDLPPAADPEATWRAACAAAALRVAATLPPGARLALVVPDRTRPLPLPRLLPPLLAALAAEKIEARRITIVPASGIHAPMSRAELAAWIGDDAARRGALLDPHDADAPARRLGRTPGGIEVAARPSVAGAGAALVLGRIVFHYLAGFGGGRKMLVPGCAARRTILAMHARCLDPRPGAGRHAAAVAGRLAGNPVHAASVAAARLFPPSTAIHTLLTGDGRLADAFAGDLFADHERACARYAAAHRALVDGPLDAVFVSAGGRPTDRDLVQAHKALEAVHGVVKDGGTVVFVARCADGVGNREVEQALRLGSPAAIEAELRRDFRVGAHTALALALKTARVRTLAVTELSDELLALAGMERAASLEEAARIVLERHGADARVALAPRGGSLLYSIP